MMYNANKQIDIKLNNQKIIADYIFQKGPLTRADIAKQINSSKPTISKNVQELIEKTILIEVGKDDNLIGKKGVLLDINQDYGYVWGIDLSKGALKSSINNLKNMQLSYLEQSFEGDIDIHALFTREFEKIKIPCERIKQVVIAYPGVVGHNGAYYLSNLQRKETILKQIIDYIENKTNLKPIIKNDINLAIYAEQHFNQYMDCKNLYYVSVDTGVGAGMIINGQLYEGDRSAAGEIGFIVPAGAKENHYATLEELISVNALLNQYYFETNKKIDVDDLAQLISVKDPIALRIYDQILEYISVAIGNIASILDIEHVVISGRVMNLSGNMVQDITKRVQGITPLDTKIYLSGLINPSLKGCILTGIKQIMDHLI